MLDAILIALALFTWCIFAFRYWRVGNALDRYEGIILRPLSISVDLLAVHYLFHGSWWPAVVAFWWGFFSISGVARGTIRPERSSKELANPPRPVSARESEALSHEDSMQLSNAIMKLSFYSFSITA